MSIKGWDNQKKYGNSEFVTVQSAGSDKKGLNTAQMYLFEVTPVALAISAVTQSTDKKSVDIDFGVAHNARKGDVIRLTTGTLKSWEFEIQAIVSANIIRVWNISPSLPLATEEAKVLRWTTALSDETGALQVSQGPLQFTRNGAPQTVVQDTATPANNRPLPAGLYFYKNGQVVPVTDDTVDPNNVAAIPVEIKAVDGTTINITAGDINVQTSSEGVNFDSMRIGDGSGVYLEINPDGSVNVVDAAVAGKLDAQAVLIGAVDETAPASDTASSGLNGRLQRIAQRLTSLIALLPGSLGQKTMAESLAVTIASNQTAVPISAASLPLPTGAATAAGQITTNGLLVSIDDNIGLSSVAAATSDTGTFPILAFIKRGMQNWTTLLARLPASLGQTTMANSLAVTMASDQILTSQPQTQVGTITSAQIAVGLAAVRATVSGAAPSANRKKLIVKPSKNNTGSIFIGPAGVTTANGLEIIGPDRVEFEFDGADYYLISDTAAQTVEILEKV